MRVASSATTNGSCNGMSGSRIGQPVGLAGSLSAMIATVADYVGTLIP
ncbi:hypothetical protein [Streptomyces sp. NPDC001642]